MSDLPTVHLVGSGIVGQRLEKLLRARTIQLHDPRRVALSKMEPGDTVLLARGGDLAPTVAALIEREVHVITVSDGLDDTRELLELDARAVGAGATLVVGAGTSPGLSGLLARYLAGKLAVVDEIHVAIHGTAGRACAREYHRSLSGRSPGWHDGQWADHMGGSGRELCWFPEPVGAHDCYRAQIATPVLLHRTFPTVERISVRRTARRRDRFTARLPMMRSPHEEGGIGALRVELRGGAADGRRLCLIAGVAELVGTAAAATAAAFTTALAEESLPEGVVITSDAALPTVRLLELIESYGVRLQEFTGVPQPG